jgi:transcriptional regulator GlxA family with amidase domain
MAYVHEHYDEPIAREDMARYASVSPRHLTRAFAQELGVSPVAYLHRWRVRQAKRLLDEGDRSITDVASAVGFSDSSHFAQVFHQQTGMSPRHYRNRSGQTAPSA